MRKTKAIGKVSKTELGMSKEEVNEKLEAVIDSLSEQICEKDDQIIILKHIIGLMGKVIDE